MSNTGAVSFDIRNTTDMDSKDIVDSIEQTIEDNYSIEESSYDEIRSGGNEYIHVNMTVEVDDEEDLDVINYVLMAIPTLTSGVDVLNIETEFIEEVEEGWNDDATWDGEDVYIDDDGLADIDEVEDDAELYNDGLYLDDEEELELQEND